MIEKLNSYNINKDDENKLEYIIGDILLNKKLTISVAESCTGGLVSSTLINYPGISSSFIEGCITYSNDAKISRLGVKKETLEKYGAVSKETAIEMAIGVSKQFNTDIGLSTTGIAGPNGATYKKPVGLVYMCIYINNNYYVNKYIFNGSRQEIRIKATEKLLADLMTKLTDL